MRQASSKEFSSIPALNNRIFSEFFPFGYVSQNLKNQIHVMVRYMPGTIKDSFIQNYLSPSSFNLFKYAESLPSFFDSPSEIDSSI
jgi:hypothetical protein